MSVATGTLWIHVGTHKTGTTSIQRALRLRRDVLQSNGIALHRDENAYLLASLFLRKDLGSTPRVKLGAPMPTPEIIREQIQNGVVASRGAAPNMIISAEDFCLLRHAAEAQELRALLRNFETIVPIIFLRNSEDWRSSRANQLAKVGLLERFTALPDHENPNGEWYYDVEGLLAFWWQIAEPMVVDYDAVVARDGSVLPAFAEAVGLPSLFEGLDLRLNQRVVLSQ